MVHYRDYVCSTRVQRRVIDAKMMVRLEATSPPGLSFPSASGQASWKCNQLVHDLSIYHHCSTIPHHSIQLIPHLSAMGSSASKATRAAGGSAIRKYPSTPSAQTSVPAPRRATPSKLGPTVHPKPQATEERTEGNTKSLFKPIALLTSDQQ
jgi:hypothetical protein